MKPPKIGRPPQVRTPKKTAARSMEYKVSGATVSSEEKTTITPTLADTIPNPAYVDIFCERLVRVAEFENIRIHIGYQMPCAPDEASMNSTRDYLLARVASEMANELSELEQE